MAQTLDELRKKVEEKKQKKEVLGGAGEQKRAETVDMDQVEKIVDRMKKKYREEGVEFEQVGGKLGELRGIIAGGEQAKINVQKVEELKEFESPAIKRLGGLYVGLRFAFDPISKLLRRLPVSNDVLYYLYSANMKFSLQQWLALSISGSFLAGLLTFAIIASVSYLYEISLVYSVLISLLVGFFIMLIMLFIPKSKADTRGNLISIELPFALRHMATELKAGIGLYKTIQTIASADYGVLSEEFQRTINEIEEGTDTKDALRHFALRTQSKALRNALFHIVRAMKTGGNLSDIMNIIAEDVSFEMRMSIRDFAEKMNFFGVIYIFIAIVIPVFIAIIGSVTNAPVSVGTVALSPMAIAATYIIIMPLILTFLIIYLKIIQPMV
ncbi:MAG TPA: type II secretion system F family protein [archaeon]|nr:type II secretion system F family protein [archaeon]